MKKVDPKQFISAFAISGILAILLVVGLTIGGELYKPLKEWLKMMFSHHWIGKGVLSFVGFYIVGLLLKRMVGGGDRVLINLLYLLFFTGLLGALAILGFYYYETFLVVH
jgi:hypothetical protein|tara:strand:+ start:18629 stop:18958 length:330 start_codon:yes stop_codon:yes gene_type:complete